MILSKIINFLFKTKVRLDEANAKLEDYKNKLEEQSKHSELPPPTYRFIESVHYDSGRTVYYFDDPEEFSKLLKDTNASEVFIDNHQHSFVEMSNGVVFCLKPVNPVDDKTNLCG